MMKITDYLITPGDIWGLLRKLKPRDLQGVAAFLVFVTLTPLLSPMTLEGAIFFAFLISMFYWRVDSRVPIGLGIVCLILIPVFMYGIVKIFSDFGTAGAKDLAIWAFYFLCIGVIRQIGEFAVEPKQ